LLSNVAGVVSLDASEVNGIKLALYTLVRLNSSLDPAIMSAPTPSLPDLHPEFPVRGGVSEVQRWSIVVLLLLASLINYLDRSIVSFALPDIARTLGLDPEAKGVLLSAFFWSYALMQIPMGLLSDRVNLRWLYAGAFMLWSLSQGLTGLANGLITLIIFRILLGIGEAIYLPGGNRIVSILFAPSDRGFPCGLFDSGTRAGMFVGGICVPWALQHYGWRTTFAVVGFSALLWLVPWFAVTPARLRAQPEDSRPMPDRTAEPAFRSVRPYRDLFGICLGFFCFDYYWYFLVTWLPDYLVNARQLTIVKAGFYASMPFLVFALCQQLGGWIGDRLVRAGWDETRVRKGVISFAFLTGLLLIPAAWVSSPTLAILLIVGGCLVGLSTPNQLVILQNCAPPDQIGLWTGIYNTVGNIAGIVAPLITGFLIKRTGSYVPAFVLSALMIAAGQLAYWFLVGKVRSA
jgi:MFS family permease